MIDVRDDAEISDMIDAHETLPGDGGWGQLEPAWERARQSIAEEAASFAGRSIKIHCEAGEVYA